MVFNPNVLSSSKKWLEGNIVYGTESSLSQNANFSETLVGYTFENGASQEFEQAFWGWANYTSFFKGLTGSLIAPGAGASNTSVEVAVLKTALPGSEYGFAGNDGLRGVLAVDELSAETHFVNLKTAYMHEVGHLLGIDHIA